MSITDATLIIEHSSAECDTDYVHSKFDVIFGNGFVIDVIEEVITAGSKKFYLIVDQDHPAFMRISDLIHENTFAAIVYKKEWDRPTRKFAELYWKVSINYHPVFTPYLMNEEQLAELRLPPPSKLERSTNQPPPAEEADFAPPTDMVRCESDICITIDAPTAMVRSESDCAAEVFEPPTAMVRSDTDNSAEVFAPPMPLVRCKDTDIIGGYAYIPPPPQLYRTSRSAEWFGEVSGN
jgi:hypothetical protein